MSGMEPIIMGAVAGAALNRDDPMKGAMMGAAEGAMASDAIPAFLANQPMGPSGLMPVDVFPVNAYPAAETIPVFNNEAIARASMGGDYTGIGSGASGSSMYSPFGGMIGYEEAAGKELAKAQAKDIMMRGGMPSLGGAMNMLGQSQPRAGMQAPGIRRGQPQAVNYGGLASLLEPKLVERRRLSLL